MISVISAIVCIVLGFVLIKYPPENINRIYGYRTNLSMKNQDTWQISQQYGAYGFLALGFLNLLLGIGAICYPLYINENIQGLFIVVGLVVFVGVEEIALRKLFNKDGSRKVKT
jgi:uncharacterized membrane protein